MREIKFRAWNGKSMLDWHWLEGMGMIGHVLLNESNDHVAMQSTGLKDKNGADIYEGDIVEDKAKRNMIVEYRELKASFFFSWVRDRNQGAFYEDLLSCHKPIEVIGNIHENPEILKETRE